MTPMETAEQIASAHMRRDNPLYESLTSAITTAIQNASNAQLARGRVRQAELETMILEAYMGAFPNYAWTDARSAIDLMLAEITTLRHEVNQRNE